MALAYSFNVAFPVIVMRGDARRSHVSLIVIDHREGLKMHSIECI